jgi:hypothetical protein
MPALPCLPACPNQCLPHSLHACLPACLACLPACLPAGCKDFKDEKGPAVVGGVCTLEAPEGCNDWGKAYYQNHTFKGVKVRSQPTLGSWCKDAIWQCAHKVELTWR